MLWTKRRFKDREFLSLLIFFKILCKLRILLFGLNILILLEHVLIITGQRRQPALDFGRARDALFQADDLDLLRIKLFIQHTNAVLNDGDAALQLNTGDVI